MSSSNPAPNGPSDAKAGPSSKTAAQEGGGAGNKSQPVEQLGVLEEDDEFEEFPAEDWPESSSTLAALTQGVGQGSDPSAHLWEDNWDDDDKEPKFAQQLRAELQSRNNSSSAMKT